MTRSPLMLFLGATLALTACASDSSAPERDTAPVEAATTTISTSTSAVELAQVPATPAEAAGLVIGLLNGSELTEAEFEAKFAMTFRDAIEFDDFSAVLAQVGADGPWTLGEPRSEAATTASYVMSAPGGEILLIDVAVSPAGEGIVGLFFSPDQVFEPPESVEDALTRLAALGRVRAVVADASNGACAPIVDAAANEVMPLGSAFKLYVLGAVVKAMDDDSISWDTPVAIRDDLDSLPSGTMQDVEPGTELSVRALAELMISISDNTATDHLIDLVGRDAVEAILVPMGNDAIERNRPFLTTRDLFILKFADPALGERYAIADETERRSILADDVAATPLPDLSLVDTSKPVLVEEVEWFASPVAMCDAMVWLTADPTAREILALDPGPPSNSPNWETIAFKGGSEPGLLSMVWWTSTANGRAFVTAGSVVSPTGPIEDAEAANLLAFLRDEGPGLDEVGGSD